MRHFPTWKCRHGLVRHGRGTVDWCSGGMTWTCWNVHASPASHPDVLLNHLHGVVLTGDDLELELRRRGRMGAVVCRLSVSYSFRMMGSW